MRRAVIVSLLILAALLARLSLYTVDASEFVYVTVLGRPIETYDGANAATGAGLHAGWPWPIQALQRLDRRLQYFDLPDTEILTHDAEGKTVDKTLSIKAYVCWRIASAGAVDTFVRTLGSPEMARSILGPRINSLLGAAVTQMSMDDLISTSEGKVAGKTRVDETMAGLRAKLLAGLQSAVSKEYGIDLVDIRLRRFSHPERVRDSIFERIRSERMKRVTEYRSDGEALAKNIESAAEEKTRALLARARFEEETLKGQADSEAALIRNQAHRQDPEFYEFLNKMKKLRSILEDNKTLLLLSTHRPLFDLLFQPPRPSVVAPAPRESDERKSKNTGAPN